MTEKELIDYIKENKKFPKTVWDYVHYIYFIFAGAFLFFGILLADSYIEIERRVDALILSAIFICVGIFSSFVIYRRLKENITFETIIPNSPITIDAIADRVKENFKLTEINVNSQLCSINAMMRYRILSEITLTIILHEKEILVNSRPDRQVTAITSLQDRLNVRKLKQILSV
jgi:hypothetical protein